MADFRDDLLTAILDCEYGDLYLLADCKYDIGEIVKECLMRFDELNINGLVRIMFSYGLEDIEAAILDRLREIDSVAKERDLDKDEESEVEALLSLRPFEDIQSFHYFSDTSIWVEDDGKKKIYKQYLQGELDHFKEMTGFDICC